MNGILMTPSGANKINSQVRSQLYSRIFVGCSFSQCLTLTFQEQLCFQSKLSKVFVHVSRCLIYKVHRCFRSLFKKRSGGLFHGNVSPRRDFSSLALRSLFVKNFFRLFSNRYAVSTNCPERAWLFYQSFSRMSTLFFDFFKIFFESQDIVSEVEIAPKI